MQESEIAHEQLRELRAREQLRRELERRLQDTSIAGLSVRTVRPFAGGNSGITYEVHLEERLRSTRAILRLSPKGVRIAGPADIGRQGRIMETLDRAGLPVPTVLAYDSAPSLDGRSWSLVGYVSGQKWEAAAAERSDRHVAMRAVETLRRIHGVELPGPGLEQTARSPTEELSHWLQLLKRSPEALRVAARPLVGALVESAPEASSPTLVHGDYHYENLIFANGQVIAVVDWEIAHVGEPLLDLGCLAVATMRSAYAPDPNPTGSVCIPIDALVEAYGAGESEAAWFIALTALKYAAIIGYNLNLHRTGKQHNPVYEQLQRTMTGLIADGIRLLAEGLPR